MYELIACMISKILVAVDGSEDSDKAFEYASYLAKRCEALLLIVHICAEISSEGKSKVEYVCFISLTSLNVQS